MATPTRQDIQKELTGPPRLQPGMLVYSNSDAITYKLNPTYSEPPLSGDWAPFGVATGSGDVTGPGVAVDNAVTRFDGTTGKIIQNSAVILDDTGAFTGISDLSLGGFEDFTGEAAPALSPGGHGRLYFDSGSNTLKLSQNGGAYTNLLGSGGDVVGPGSSTDNAISRFDGTTGKLIQNSVVIVGDTGIITGVLDLSQTGFHDFTEEAAPSISASGHSRIYADSTSHTLKLSENNGAYFNIGDVRGPVSSTDNAFARFDSTSGKLIQNSVVIGDDTGNVSGIVNISITGFEDWTEEAAPALSASGHGRIYVDSTTHLFNVSENGGAYVPLVTITSGFVVGPGSATDNAVSRFDGTTGKLIQNSVVIIGDTGVVTGVLDFNLAGFEDWTEEVAPALSASGHGRIYVDSTTHLFNVSENGGAYVPLVAVTSSFVVGPGSSTDNAVARFDSTTGKLIQNSGAIIDDSNNVSGVGSFSLATFEDFTESAAPSVSAAGHGRMYIDSTSHVFRLSENGAAYFTIGDVRGPASATDNAVSRFDLTTGKIIQNSGVIIDDSNNVTGVVNLSQTGFQDYTEMAAPAASAAGHTRVYADSTSHTFKFSENAGSYFDFGNVRGPASATDNAVARFDATTGKLIQNSAVIVDDSGNMSGVGTLSITSLTITGSITLPYTASAAGNYTVLTTDYYIGKTGITGGGDTVTLPVASGNTGKAFIIHDESGTAATNNITVAVASSGTIDGQATIVITANYGTGRFFSNGTTYDSW